MRDMHAEAQAAQEQLSNLFAVLSSEQGGKVPFDCFYPVDVDRLVKDVGWRVEVVDDPGYVGPLRRAHATADRESRFVLLSRKEPAERRRFTLAHELGHILLHPGTLFARSTPHSVRQNVRGGPDQRFEAIETSADRFATELLMPAKAVRRAFKNRFATISLNTSDAVSLFKINTRDRYQIAQAASRCEREGHKSLCVFFGVSQSAMARRLLELEIIV
jgi:Zn-dependent peptidase ImmA (M78 family)